MGRRTVYTEQNGARDEESGSLELYINVIKDKARIGLVNTLCAVIIAVFDVYL